MTNCGRGFCLESEGHAEYEERETMVDFSATGNYHLDSFILCFKVINNAKISFFVYIKSWKHELAVRMTFK